MKDSMNVIGVGIDHDKKEIVFMTNFVYKKSQEYIKVCKMLTTKINNIMQYAVIFNNRSFKNIIKLGEGCAMAFDKEIDNLINPNLNTKALKSLGIISVDFKNKFVEFDTAISKTNALNLIRSIPTLIPLKIKYGDRIYNSVASMAKDIFKDYKPSDTIHLTNEFAKELLELIKKEGANND